MDGWLGYRCLLYVVPGLTPVLTTGLTDMSYERAREMPSKQMVPETKWCLFNLSTIHHAPASTTQEGQADVAMLTPPLNVCSASQVRGPPSQQQNHSYDSQRNSAAAHPQASGGGFRGQNSGSSVPPRAAAPPARPQMPAAAGPGPAAAPRSAPAAPPIAHKVGWRQGSIYLPSSFFFVFKKGN